MRERRYLTFDMQNPRHREAFTLFSEQPNKLRSEYVVNCILKAKEENRLEETIRRVIEATLKNAAFSIVDSQGAEASLQATNDISDLPDALLSSLEDI